MLIGELARRTGTSARSLRHYDRHGLLPVERTDSGYRDFPAEALGRVEAIRGLLVCGLTVADIRTLLPCTGTDGVVQPCSEVLARLHERLEQLDQRAAEVQQARRAVQQRLSFLTAIS